MLIWKDKDSVLLFQGEDITYGMEVPAGQIEGRYLEILKERGQVGPPEPVVIPKRKAPEKKAPEKRAPEKKAPEKRGK